MATVGRARKGHMVQWGHGAGGHVHSAGLEVVAERVEVNEVKRG